jgi:hypothetical protein
MQERYDLQRLFKEIKEDEQVGEKNQTRIISQDEIRRMVALRRKEKRGG